MQEGNLLVCIEDALPPVVRASGELDHDSCTEFESVLQQVVDKGHSTIVLDLNDLVFVDSCGVRLLIKAAVDAGKTGRSLHIASMTPHLHHVLTLSGFRHLFGDTARIAEPRTAVASKPAGGQCFEVPGVPGACRQVRNVVAQFATEMGFGQLDVDDIKLAVGEAISNAIRHGSICDETIEVKCENRDGTLTVSLKYPSSAFDPQAVPAPTYASAPEGGMGIHFMRLVMDNVAYDFQDGFTLLTIEKRLG